MSTGLFEGRVYHARTKCLSSPLAHDFGYPVWMGLIDLDQVEERPDTVPDSVWCSFTGRARGLAQWRRTDHFGSNKRLSVDVRDLVKERTGRTDIARIELVTNLSTLGLYNFNPASIYYCYSSQNELCAAVLEVSNTPWLDKRLYVLKFEEGNPKRVCWEKDFHVSPFMDGSHFYDWTLRPLGEDGRLVIHAISKRRDVTDPEVRWEKPHVNGSGPICPIQYSSISQQPTTFIVKLDLQRVNKDAIWKAVLRNPVMPLSAVLWIHIEAFKVWSGGANYVTPPPKSRLLDMKDALVHLIVFAVAIFVRYGVILPLTSLRNIVLWLTK